MCDCSSSLRRNSAFKLVAELRLLQTTVLALLSLGSYLWCLGAMALDTLRYGSFKPTYVAADTKALPGYGGEVQSWADYRFAVEALEKKEAQIAEGERKKLGPLALRLTERLVGPALQVAKKVGVEKLSQPDGVRYCGKPWGNNCFHSGSKRPWSCIELECAKGSYRGKLVSR